jgi:hypothetical protein
MVLYPWEEGIFREKVKKSESSSLSKEAKLAKPEFYFWPKNKVLVV